MTNFMRLLHAVYTFESLNTDDEKGLVRVLRRTHENLGHPSTPRFVSMLKAARARNVSSWPRVCHALLVGR